MERNIGLKKRYLIFLILSFFCLTNNAKARKIRSPNHKKIKVLFVLDKFPWYTKAIIVNQIVALIEAGFHVDIYSRRRKFSEKIDSKVYEYDLLSRTYYEDLPPNLKDYHIIICQYGGEGKRFVDVMNKFKLKGKLVTCIRGGDITSKLEIADNAYKQLFRKGDLFLPVCQYFKSRLVMFGCEDKKIFVLHSAIDCLKFKYKRRKISSGEKIRILSVNRLYEEKANDYVIRAIAKILPDCPNIEYWIVGDGPERDRLELLVKNLGLEKVVKFFGWCDQEQVVDILQQVHIFVLASVTAVRGAQEGIPNALKEAMAVGMPVVSTFHAGIPELVEDGVSGFLVPEREIISLTERIKYLIQHPEVWPKMGMRGRDKVKREFEMHKTNKRFIKLLMRLMPK